MLEKPSKQMWTTSVLLCFSIKDTVSELLAYKVEPYTFHVCLFFVFFLLNAFSTLPSVAEQVSLFVSRLACLVKRSRKEFFLTLYESIKQNTAISHNPYEHTHGQGPAHTHTHPHAQCKMWMDNGVAVVVGSHSKSRSGFNALTVFTTFPVIICPFERVSALQCSGTPVQASPGSVGSALQAVLVFDVCLVASVGVNVFRSEQQQQQHVGSQVAASFRLDDTCQRAPSVFFPIQNDGDFFFNDQTDACSTINIPISLGSASRSSGQTPPRPLLACSSKDRCALQYSIGLLFSLLSAHMFWFLSFFLIIIKCIFYVLMQHTSPGGCSWLF